MPIGGGLMSETAVCAWIIAVRFVCLEPPLTVIARTADVLPRDVQV